jgi:hypothetical protein
MPDRIAQAWADAQQASEATRWAAFCRKIEKTAWSIADHKKTEVAVAAAGAAISIAVGVLTGGLSLAVQFGVGLAMGLGQRTMGRVAGYANYEANKGALETAIGDTAGREDRKSVRMAYKNFQYNEGYFQDGLYAAIESFRDLQARAQTPIANAEDLQAMIYSFVVFKDEYERALHYFIQYERFVEYEAKFLTAAGTTYNAKYDEYKAAVEETIKQNRAWHKATCRKSRLSTDICYGLRDTEPEINNSTYGNPHHRMV